MSDSTLPVASDLERYPRPSVAADLAVFTIVREPRTSKKGRREMPEAQLRVLLVRRGQEPYKGLWALPGGFIHEGETIEEAAARELREETGADGITPQLLGVYSDPGRDPRRWVMSVAFCALVEASHLHISGASDAAEAGWRQTHELAALRLAFDHDRILQDALLLVRHRVMTTLAVREFLPETFVLAELYGVLKAVVPEYNEEPANFRRKVIGRGIIEPLGETEQRYSQRPAQLFRFTGAVPELSAF